MAITAHPHLYLAVNRTWNQKTIWNGLNTIIALDRPQLDLIGNYYTSTTLIE